MLSEPFAVLTRIWLKMKEVLITVRWTRMEC